MRIVLMGQAAFGAAVFKALNAKGEELVAVYAPVDRPGGRLDPLKEAALEKGVAVVQPKTYKDDRVFADYQALQPDLTVMAFVTDIIPARYFEVPGNGTINYHPSLLPRHRGASAINWAVIMGDSRTGLSIFWPDGGIDTGLILLQKEVPIGPEDTTGSLYFNHLFPMGVDAILESIDLIKADAAPKIEQDESQSTYEPPCDDRAARIDWRQPVGDLFNLIRGCDPQPGAYIDLKGEQIRFFGVKLVNETSDERPGSICKIDEQGLHVAGSGGRLIFGKIKPPDGKKAPASEYAIAKGWGPGDLLFE
jgi:methionyl-tRNA formyltransferase